MNHITASQFAKSFASLILGGRVMPKKQISQHILFFSATLALQPDREYAEKELNEILGAWSSQFGGNFNLDHVTLRRYLVDTGYLTRDASGSSYRLGDGDPLTSFDDAIREIDLVVLVREAKANRERRKRQYSSGSQD